MANFLHFLNHKHKTHKTVEELIQNTFFSLISITNTIFLCMQIPCFPGNWDVPNPETIGFPNLQRAPSMLSQQETALSDLRDFFLGGPGDLFIIQSMILKTNPTSIGL